jgi:signal recognition particle subunit SRP72
LTLLRQTTIDDHEEVLKAANAALKKTKSDLEAQHVKAVALLNLERYDDVLKVFEDGGDRLKERAKLEYAYALYRAGHQVEAVKISEAVDGGRGVKHVLAQAVGLSGFGYVDI